MVVLLVLCLIGLVLLSYSQGRADASKKREKEIEFLSAFSLFLQSELMVSKGELDSSLSEQEKINQATMPYIIKMSLFKNAWLKAQKRKEIDEVSSLEGSETEGGPMEQS